MTDDHDDKQPEPEQQPEPEPAAAAEPEAAPEPEPGKPDTTAYHAESARLISDAEMATTQAEECWRSADAHAKGLKKQLENLEIGLRRLIRERRSGLSELERGQGLLPFAGTAPTADESAQDAEQAEWFAVPVAALGLTSRIEEALLEADLNTIGDIAQFTRSAQLSEIEGIGQASADKVSDAMIDLWERRQRDKAAVAEPEAPASKATEPEAETPAAEQPKPKRGRPRKAS